MVQASPSKCTMNQKLTLVYLTSLDKWANITEDPINSAVPLQCPWDNEISRYRNSTGIANEYVA